MANSDSVDAYLSRLWESQKTNGFADFAGLRIDLFVPITQPILDDLISPVPFPESIRSFRLRFTDTDLVTFELALSLFLFKTNIRVQARVERYVAFPSDPILKLTLLNGGLVEMGLNMVTLPDWIKVAGKEVSVDLGAVLRSSGAGWIVPQLRDVRFNVHPGVLNLQGTIIGP